MISVITCSNNPSLCESIKSNIELTIGTPYEFIIINNATNEFNIAQAYNRGALEANYPILCFVHEDVMFHTNNWGKLVLNHFSSDSKIGLMGIAGGVYKSAAPSAWFPPFAPGGFPIHKRILQHYNNDYVDEKVNPLNDVITRVATVAGVWLCCRRWIWEKVKFDEKIGGFHGYDMDFSLGVNRIAKVIVVYDILLEHFSPGKYDAAWIEATYRLHKKWKWLLPLNFSNTTKEDRVEVELLTRDAFIKAMKECGFNPVRILATIWGIGSLRFFDLRKFYYWHRGWLSYVVHYSRKR